MKPAYHNPVPEERVVANLVRCREGCRQVMYVLRRLLSVEQELLGDHEAMLRRKADRALDGFLRCCRTIPRKPSEISGGSKRREVMCLVREIGDLLDSALVVEREIRTRFTEPMQRKEMNQMLSEMCG